MLIFINIILIYAEKHLNFVIVVKQIKNSVYAQI